jgi:hypothetical protein
VSNQSSDVEHLEAMLEMTIANTGQVPTSFITDAGYWSEANAKACTARGADSDRLCAEAFLAWRHHRRGAPHRPLEPAP